MIKGRLIFNIDINYISTSMYCLTRHKYLARLTMKLKKRRKKEEEKKKETSRDVRMIRFRKKRT